MALDLTIAETRVFRELTGHSWTAAQKAFQPVLCQPHRLSVKACKACRQAAAGMCDDHLDAFRECENCTAGDAAPDEWLAAAVYIVRRRNGEKRDFDAYCNETTYGAMVAEMAELGKTEPGDSTGNTSSGSRRSSTGSRRSTRRSSRS